MPGEPRRWWPWALVAVSGALCAAGGVAAWSDPDLVAFLPVNTAVAVGYPAVGALVLTRHPRNPIGRLLLLPVSLAVATAAGGYAAADLPGARWAAWLTLWAWVPAIVALPLLLLLLFPDGRLPSPRWHPVLVAVLAAGGAVLAWGAMHPGPNPNFPRWDNPLGVSWVPELAGAPLLATGVVVLVLLAAALASLVVRFRRSVGVERAQLSWFVAAGVVLLLGQAALLALPGAIGTVVELVAVLVVPAAVGIAIARYRLYDIDIVVNRSLVYGALTAALLLTYVGVVTVLGELFRTRSALGPSLVATALVAVMFAPLRQWLQRGVDRLLYRHRADPYAMLALLGQRLQATRVPAEVLPVVTETIAVALRLPYVAVELTSGDRVAHGRPAGEERVLPLTYQSETLGNLVVTPAAGSAFGRAEQRLLDDVTRQVGVAAWAVRLSSDLQRSREQLVTTREEERRRLRRDLHDGLGAALSGIGFSVDAAAATLGRDPRAACELLTGVKGQTRDAIGTIRRLVNGLRPPSLDDLGLQGTLRAHVASLDAVGTCVTLDLHGHLDALPPAVEVATYWIVVEALTNVARHARAEECRVTVRCEDGVRIDVRDDGTGVAADARPGVGLSSMRERAEEIGGTCTVTAGPRGGTLVTARLPVVPA